MENATSSLLPTGLPTLDRCLGGGWRKGGLMQLRGTNGSGKTTLALRTAAETTQQRERVALVSRGRYFYPPGLTAQRVVLSYLLWVTPQDSARLFWAAVEVSRSGLFPLVIAHHLHVTEKEARRLQLAAETGGSVVIVLAPAGNHALPWPFYFCGVVERQVHDRLRLQVIRSRTMLTQQTFEVPLYENENLSSPTPDTGRARFAS